MNLRESNRIMDWRKLRYMKLHHSYSSADIFRAQNQGLWKRHERRTRKARTNYTLLVGKNLRKATGIYRHKWQDNIKTDPTYLRSKDVK